MSNPNLYASQPFGPNSGSNPAGINPAMLAASFQNGPLAPQQQQQQKFSQNVFGGGVVNPAQLMGAGGVAMNMGMTMNPSSVNPTQLLQQQQQQQQQHGMMNGGMSGGMSMNLMAMNPAVMAMNPMASINSGGINPAAFSQSSNPGFNPMAQSQHHPSLQQGPQVPIQQHQQQPQQHSLMTQQQMLLTALGLTREQYNGLSQQEKQLAWMKVFPMQFANNSNSSVAPSGLQHQQMMPPPALPQSQSGPISVPGRPPTSQGQQQRLLMAQGQQRPPTAQGQQRPPTAQGQQRPPTAQGAQIHRPSTAQGHRGVSVPGSTPQTPNPVSASLSMGMAQMQRPPTTQDQRHGPSGQQTRPPTTQSTPQTPIHPSHGPPGTRPSITQSGVIGQQISRPGTALSHQSPVSASGSANAQSPGVRPPSRIGSEQQVCSFRFMLVDFYSSISLTLSIRAGLWCQWLSEISATNVSVTVW